MKCLQSMSWGLHGDLSRGILRNDKVGREGGRRWHSPSICSTDWIMMMRVMIVRIMTHNSCWGKRKQYLLSAMTSSTAMSPPRPEWNLKVAIVGLSKRRLRWPCVGCRVLELRRGGSDCVRRWQATGGGACRRKWEICGWIYFPEFFLIQFSAYPKDFFFPTFLCKFSHCDYDVRCFRLQLEV